MIHKTQKLFQSLILASLMFGFSFQNVHAAPANLSISNVPLFLGSSVQPNVFFLMDDSESMNYEIFTSDHWNYAMYDSDDLRKGFFESADLGYALDRDGQPDILGNNKVAEWYYLYDNAGNGGNNCSGGTTVASCTTKLPADLDWRIRSSSFNVTFYNPSVAYLPWNGSCANTAMGAACTDGDFFSAETDPKDCSGCADEQRDLSVDGDTQGGPFVYDVWIDDSGFTGARPGRGDNFNETGTAAGTAAAPNKMVDLWDSHLRFAVGATAVSLSYYEYDPQTSAEASPGLNETLTGSATLNDMSACYDILGSNDRVISVLSALQAEPDPVKQVAIIHSTDGAGCKTIASIQTNVANWYQYNRRRYSTVKGAISSVIDAQPKFRYGLTKYKGGVGSLFVQAPLKATTDVTADNANLKHEMYGDVAESTGTLMLAGMERVGDYFTDNLSSFSSPIHYSCQKNFEIIFSDGYATDSTNTTAIGDADGDGYEISGADIARYYYMNDLDLTVDNVVSPDPGEEEDLDPLNTGKTWQHLVAFTVAFGVKGNMSDDDGDGWPDKDAAGNDWTEKGIPDKDGNWGDPISGTDLSAKIDDLWHLAYNTNGTYANATTPEEVLEQLLAAISNIAGRTGSASAVALNSGTLNANTRIYQAKFNSVDWSGDVESVPVKGPTEIDPVTSLPIPDSPRCAGKVLGEVCDEEWSAGDLLEKRLYSTRNIFSFNTDTKALVQFKTLADLGVSQQTKLMTHPDTGSLQTVFEGQARLDWVRGLDADDMRKRPGGDASDDYTNNKKLGDVIASSPAFVGAPDFLFPDSLEASPYSTFVATNKTRKKMIYVGANDGMMHAISAESKEDGGGTEIFAYIPGQLVNKLNKLTSKTYKSKHLYLIDGSPRTFDIFSGGWKTMLASSTGAGAQMVFGMEVTNPEAFSISSKTWEFTDSNDVDLGYTIGDVEFGRMNDGTWVVIFGNGFNNTVADDNVSSTGNGVIYIVNAYTGALIKKFDTGVGYADDPTGGNRPNGIASVTPVDLDGNLTVDALYAGDLFGNVWKIDTSSPAINDWDYAHKSGTDPKPFYVAVDPSGKVQPVTAPVSVKKHPENGKQTLVLFGTGQYFEVGDNAVTSSSQVQSFYSIWDDDSAASSAAYTRTNLLQHYIEDQQDTVPVGDLDQLDDRRFTTTGETSTYLIDWSTCATCKSHKGWFFDLNYISKTTSPTEYGERVVRKAVIRSGRVIFVTLLPDSEACGFGGSSWIMEMDANTGSRLPESPFDINGDGIIDDKDVLALGGVDSIVSGVRSKEGIVATPGILNNPKGDEFKYFSGTSGSVDVVQESAGVDGIKRQSYRQLK